MLTQRNLALALVLLPSAFALAQETTFTKIIVGDIVNDGGNSLGCAWGDYDNNGFLDLFVANYDIQNNFLYRNNGNGNFTKIITGAIVTDRGNSVGPSWGDYDNDGFLDLFVVNDGQDSFLYRNNGDGSFTKVTTGAIVNDGGNSFAASWGDYDNDGFLDLFVANILGQKNFLYRNNGDGSFTKITAGAIVNDGGNSYGANWGDYDNDGFLDLFVANYGQNNFLYRNNGNGSFTRITTGAIVNDGGNSLGTSWGDYDNDGFLDLFVANYGQNNFLYHNNGYGSFTKITTGAIVNDGGNSVDASWADYNNDGFLDLFVANDGQNNFLYHNNGNGSFTKITADAIVNDGGDSFGASWGDYDKDGFVDLFVANHHGQNNFFYSNNGNNNNWINIRLVGAVSNRSGIGAKVRVKAIINGAPVWQMQELSGQAGNSLNAEFGLGDATMVDSIRVQWPNGTIQDTTNVVVKQFLIMTERPFTRIIIGAIANDGGYSSGASWGDYNNDGFLDLFVANSDNQNNFLYRNNGNGTFSKITTGAIVNDGGNSFAASWGDYDNDGFLDLFVANSDNQNNFLYRNNDDGSFTKITTGAIVNDGGNSYGASWGDYDNDGFLDLYVTNCCGQNNFLYRNIGDDSFTKITTGAIVNDGGDSFGASWGDYNNDGFLDLFVANFGENNLLYRNNGDRSFTKITTGAIVNDHGNSIGASWGDYNNDGFLDLFVANQYQNNFLYRNNGDGSFTKITTGAIVNDRQDFADVRGACWGDFDNDGFLDLFVTDGDNILYSKNSLYRNNGNGSFTEITNAIVNEGENSYGASWGDYDNDGFLDLFVANSKNFLYRNNGNGNNWVNIGLIGTTSSRSGIGAKVRVKAAINGSVVWQTQELSGQTGSGGQNSLNAEFGLKNAAIIDSIEIRWPSPERTINVYTNVRVNQFLTYRENSRPRVAHAIEDITLSEVGRDSVLDLNAAPPLFKDLDHDTLAYSALSSNNQIAAVSISGSVLTLALVSDKVSDRARITISSDDGRVDDGRGNIQETSFEINRPPLFFRPIANQVFTATDSTFRFVANLFDIFTDPDNDQVEYSLNNSDSTVAFVDIRGTVLVAAPGGLQGESTVTVVADDRRGGMRSTTFKIINSRNTPPRLAGSGIADQSLILAGRPFSQPLYAVFNDAENDSLIFTARSSNRNVALALVDNDTLTLVPIALGNAQITVTANDGKGGEVTTSFHVTIARSQAPQIAHNPLPEPQPLSTPITVTATITDDDSTKPKTLLNYRIAGRPIFDKRDMQIEKIDSTTFRVTGEIPREAVTNQGVEYKIEATDNYAVSSSNPSKGFYSVRVRVAAGVSHTLPGGEERSNYHLFSTPLELDNKSPNAVLRDLGLPYDILKWRFYELAADSTSDAYSYREYPNTDSLRPGKAYWLITRKSSVINTGAGTTIPTSERYPIALQRGWNFVGNPFNFETIVDTAFNVAGLDFYTREFGKSWNDPQPASAIVLQPFSGYAVYAHTARTLFINPHRFGEGAQLAKPERDEAEELWSIRIVAQCQRAQDRNNVAAIVNHASQAWDAGDHPEPPVIGEYVSVYFPHREWNALAKTYCIDARPEPTEGEVWDFEVKTNIRDKVNLTFEGIANVPSAFEVWLVDEALQITQNLRESQAYSVAGSEHPKALKLVVGKREFISQQLAEINLVPAMYELSQNFPNPFNPVTTIRYGLPQAERVSLKIYSVLGEEVATLVNDEHKAAGYHVAIWDGRGKNGNVAASGVYFFRLNARHFVLTRKVILLE